MLMRTLFRCRKIFPLGFPETFSFRATFRKRNGARKDNWNLITVKDRFGNEQFGVGLRPRQELITLFIKDYNGQLQSLNFAAPSVRLINYLFINLSLILYLYF